MIKLFKLILILKFLLSLTLVNSYSASTTGAATVYKVTMKKVELCTASTGVSSCENAVIIGDTSKEVNIVDAAEGAAAANYGDPALLPLGTTYSHMRVTIDRKFIIKADLAVEGVDTGNCATTAALSGSAYPGGSLSDLEKYDRTPIVAANGTAAEADLYLKNDQMQTCTNAACSAVSTANTVTYQQGVVSTFQSQHADESSSDDHVLVYELTTPYTVALISPIIDISFGTQKAVKATEVADGAEACYFEPMEPIVTVTIK